jgi:DNA-binding transcriptional MerR regulator/quercetin dioxygenase-like cupin family protein
MPGAGRRATKSNGHLRGRPATLRSPGGPVPPQRPSDTASVYIQQAASMVGATPEALRAWERQSLIAPERTASGYRLYSMADIERMRRIRALVGAGVNAEGVRRLLEEPDTATSPNGVGSHNDEPGHARGVGHTIRDRRQRNGLSLRGLSRLTGLSASYLSAVERGAAAPSIASLQKLGAALGTNVLGLMSGSYAPPDDPLVRATNRRVLTDDKGVTIEDLSTAGSNLEPLLFTFQPGAGSDGPISHEGEEFLFVLCGTLELELDGSDVYRLSSGDSMAYRSERSHKFGNDGTELTQVLWINTPRTF